MFEKWKKTGKGKGPAKRPDTGEIAVAQVTDKYSDYPSNGLTPVKLANIFREADAGDVLRQSELFEEMEEKDPHLFSQLQTRKQAVTGLDFEVLPFDPNDSRDKEIAQFVSEALKNMEEIEEVEIDLLDAIGKGFAVSEILWETTEGQVLVKEIRSRPQKRFFWGGMDDKIRVRTMEHPEGVLLPENKFIQHRYKARSGHPSRAGVLRVVAWMYLFKNYNVKDWISFCEVYGLPLRLGKYAQGASDEDKAALMRALVQIGADAAGIVPEGTSIEFINTEKTGTLDLFERFSRYADEQVSKAILGQTLTSDSGGGSYAQSKTHNEVRHDLTVADCKALAATLRRDLIRPLVLYNFGEEQRIPFLRYDCEESGDLKEEAEILGVLIEKVGLKVPTSYIYKKFGIPKPEGGEETVGAPRPAPLSDFPESAMKALKEGGKKGSQARVDELTERVIKKNAGAFEKMAAPLFRLLEPAKSLEEAKEKLERDEYLEILLKEMQVKDFEELLYRSMLFADLEGRGAEDGGD